MITAGVYFIFYFCFSLLPASLEFVIMVNHMLLKLRDFTVTSSMHCPSHDPRSGSILHCIVVYLTSVPFYGPCLSEFGALLHTLLQWLTYYIYHMLFCIPGTACTSMICYNIYITFVLPWQLCILHWCILFGLCPAPCLSSDVKFFTVFQTFYHSFLWSLCFYFLHPWHYLFTHYFAHIFNHAKVLYYFSCYCLIIYAVN